MTEAIEVREKNGKNQFIQEVMEHLKQLAAETDKVKQSGFFRQYLECMAKSILGEALHRVRPARLQNRRSLLRVGYRAKRKHWRYPSVDTPTRRKLGNCA